MLSRKANCLVRGVLRHSVHLGAELPRGHGGLVRLLLYMELLHNLSLLLVFELYITNST